MCSDSCRIVLRQFLGRRDVRSFPHHQISPGMETVGFYRARGALRLPFHLGAGVCESHPDIGGHIPFSGRLRMVLLGGRLSAVWHQTGLGRRSNQSSIALAFGCDTRRALPSLRFHRRARLTLNLATGLLFIVIDPPSGNEQEAGVSTIDTGGGQPATAPRPLPEIPKECFLCWLFVVRRNSFIRIAARSVSHEWIDPR